MTTTTPRPSHARDTSRDRSHDRSRDRSHAHDPNFVYPDEQHVCTCLRCSDDVKRCYYAPSSEMPVTLRPGRTPLRWHDWRLSFADGTRADYIVACFTGDATRAPWALSISVYAPPDPRAHRTGLHAHRCTCGSGKPCMRVFHDALSIEYIGPVASYLDDVDD